MGAYNIVNQANLIAGQPEDISTVLANFQAIQAVLNGGIDNSNINAAAAILASKISGYPTDATKYLRGDGAWVAVGAQVSGANVSGANTDLIAPVSIVNFWTIGTGGGSVRSIGAAPAGTVINLTSTASSVVTLKHQLAGGSGAMLYLYPGAGDKVLPPGGRIQLQFDGTNWVEINRSGHELICDLTLGSSQPSIDTNTILGGNIPQVYNSLRLLLIIRDDTAALGITPFLRFNNDSGANYNWSLTRENNGTVTAGLQVGATSFPLVGAGASASANKFSVVELTIPAYTQTSIQKAFTSNQYLDANDTNGQLYGDNKHGSWKSTAAINRIAVFPQGANLVAGSRFSLFGIS